jgi:crossover junction endodeoxyribonuclease RusA
MISFHVPGLPQPQGSAKAFVVNGRAHVTTANPKLKSWRVDVASIAQRHIQGAYAGAVDVRATFTFPRPKSHYRTGRNAGLLRDGAPAWHSQKPDADKLARGLLDALTLAGIWKDDSQVFALTVQKRWGECAGTDVEIRP